MSSISTTFSALRRRPNSLVTEAPAFVDTTRLTSSNAAVNIFIVLLFVQVDISLWMNDLHEDCAITKRCRITMQPRRNQMISMDAVIGRMCSEATSKSQIGGASVKSAGERDV
jgi:hypothetical protein